MIRYSVMFMDPGNPLHEVIMDKYYAKLFLSKHAYFAFPEADVLDYRDAMDNIFEGGDLLAVFSSGQGLPVATSHLTGRNGMSAFIHFNFNPDFRGAHTEVGFAVLDFIFSLKLKSSSEPAYETLVGKTPAYNRPAIKFVKKLGFEELGRIEKSMRSRHNDKIVDTIVTKLTRDRYGRVHRPEYTPGEERAERSDSSGRCEKVCSAAIQSSSSLRT